MISPVGQNSMDDARNMEASTGGTSDNVGGESFDICSLVFF